ncbi:MAG: hypothetical protein AAF604_22915 [Acidobacteriota bacterium]
MNGDCPPPDRPAEVRPADEQAANEQVADEQAAEAPAEEAREESAPQADESAREEPDSGEPSRNEENGSEESREPASEAGFEDGAGSPGTSSEELTPEQYAKLDSRLGAAFGDPEMQSFEITVTFSGAIPAAEELLPYGLGRIGDLVIGRVDRAAVRRLAARDEVFSLSLMGSSLLR